MVTGFFKKQSGLRKYSDKEFAEMGKKFTPPPILVDPPLRLPKIPKLKTRPQGLERMQPIIGRLTGDF